MIEIYDYTDEDFRAVMQFEGWKIGLLRYSDRFSKCGVLERHLLTDEVFVLLSGSATLYEKSDTIRSYPMETNKVYNVPKGVWHHIVVSPDATVLVVENANTAKDNTEKTDFE